MQGNEMQQNAMNCMEMNGTVMKCNKMQRAKKYD